MNMLKQTQTSDLEEGTVTKIGASRRPDKVYVLSIEEDIVEYVHLDAEKYGTERRAIFEDLHAQAMKTLQKRRKELREELGEKVAKVRATNYMQGRTPKEDEQKIIDEVAA